MDKPTTKKIEIKDFTFGPTNLYSMPRLYTDHQHSKSQQKNFRIAPPLNFRGHR